MRYLSLFSGIEAASVAWEPLGWKPAAFAELDKFPAALLAYRYPHVTNLGDVTKADFDAIGPVGLTVFGSPCQSFSTAGNRLGLDDPRGNLALVGAQIAYRKRSKWCIFENVPGILSSDFGWDFGTLLAAFAGYPAGSVFEPPAGGWRNSGFVQQSSTSGYGLAWRVLDAQFVRVDGFGRAVPQRRRRVFVVGYLGDWRRASAILFEPEGLSWDSAPRRSTGQGFAADVVSSLVSSGRGVARTGETRGQDPLIAEVAGTLNGAGHPGRQSAQDAISGMLLAFGGNNTSGPIEVATARNAAGTATGRLDFESETFIVPVVADTLTAYWERSKGAKAGNQVGLINPIIEPDAQSWAVRRLTPRECERLQGFPDDYTLIPRRGKPAADGPRYKALGNSMAVNCMRWIGRRIEMMDNVCRTDT